VLVVFEARSRTRIASRRTSSQPFRSFERGDVVRARGESLRVTSIVTTIEEREEVIEHVTQLYTNAIPKRVPSNVVQMPAGDEDSDTTVAQFLRYHVLVRVFHGDPDAWLAELQQRGSDADGGDVRFARWIRSRLRKDPALLASIERMVDATPFWRVAEA
jgi:hypothetical protein